MKKLIFSTLIALFAVTTILVGVSASTSPLGKEQVGPYEGKFSGYVYGANGSKATLTLVLTHRDGVVQGMANLGEGMYVKAGRCGSGYLPRYSQHIQGNSLPTNPNQIIANTYFKISNFQIGVELDSSISEDGRVLSAQAEIDIPWICGKDPQFSGTLYRVQ